MNKIYRLIDANINRAAEGIRVAEDIARLYFDNKELTSSLRSLRHNVREGVNEILPALLKSRDSGNDVGTVISSITSDDDKKSIPELCAANFKRAQEAIRVIEETLRVAGMYELSKIYEQKRFICYQFEKDFRVFMDYKNSRLDKRKRLDTDIYCITAEEHSRGRSNIEVVQKMINSGIKLIQYREKDKCMSQKLKECIAIREITQAAGVTFIVNDNIEIALLVGADGVHIGQDDIAIEHVRKLVGNEMIIGVSTHSEDQARKAIKDGADYIGVGPIYKTFTKKNVCDPVGLSYLDHVVKNHNIPFVAIGGIKEKNIKEIRTHGANLIALVTEIVGAEDIESKIKSIREKW